MSFYFGLMFDKKKESKRLTKQISAVFLFFFGFCVSVFMMPDDFLTTDYFDFDFIIVHEMKKE